MTVRSGWTPGQGRIPYWASNTHYSLGHPAPAVFPLDRPDGFARWKSPWLLTTSKSEPCNCPSLQNLVLARTLQAKLRRSSLCTLRSLTLQRAQAQGTGELLCSRAGREGVGVTQVLEKRFPSVLHEVAQSWCVGLLARSDQPQEVTAGCFGDTVVHKEIFKPHSTIFVFPILPSPERFDEKPTDFSVGNSELLTLIAPGCQGSRHF